MNFAKPLGLTSGKKAVPSGLTKRQVRKISKLTLVDSVPILWNIRPMSGISPINGTRSFMVFVVSLSIPPRTIVSPSYIVIFVSIADFAQ